VTLPDAEISSGLNIQRPNYLATIPQGFAGITGDRPRSATADEVAVVGPPADAR
jgi:hypothetical protein